jgi:hypothetical protein
MDPNVKSYFYVTSVNKIRSPDDADNDNLRILWQVDHGFLLAAVQTLVKILDHYYQPGSNHITKKIWEGVVLLKNFKDEEGLYLSEMDNERLLNFHKMIVTNSLFL